MQRRALIRRLAPALAASVLLAGCGSDTPSASPADNAADPLCASVSAHWPTTVGGKDRVRIDVSGDQSSADVAKTVAAWGDPAIIARCGVAAPGPSTDCIEADNIDWVMSSLSDGKRFVTYGRVPAIEVLVPSSYSPEPLVLSAFDEAAAQVPQNSHRCS
ncbi:uncharacterized protein DUF3515 [Branchiibius hedensis]|uniref:DUF3515 domain-containing protein n=1 Tax=Branchiibius hedensis TaxID=672460 RepID=A0A2Y8ZQY8_9MICO|nr:DUF3515 family protein [Branchiibius hedensis]PWJ25938.1 uncharacterized protein DUF3515 [Branchiibius hedensis]SSA34751.1 Protein of unknown function [Branchiibius hedensis]